MLLDISLVLDIVISVFPLKIIFKNAEEDNDSEAPDGSSQDFTVSIETGPLTSEALFGKALFTLHCHQKAISLGQSHTTLTMNRGLEHLSVLKKKKKEDEEKGILKNLFLSVIGEDWLAAFSPQDFS